MILDDVKLALRIRSTALDQDINNLIDACRTDMRMAGIRAPDVMPGAEVDDPIIKRAIILYCKSDYDVDGAAERHLATYEHLKAALALSTEHNAEAGGADE